MWPLGESDPLAISSYKLLGVLGGGGMGKVYLGESRSGRRVAIKVVRPELPGDPTFRRRLAREVAAVHAVNPLFTAAVVDADPEAAEPWLATTYIAGPNLATLVAKAGPLAPSAVLILAAGLADGLASIHRAGLVHRDLKPSNVIVTDQGPDIIDFGIALSAESASATSRLLLGTPSYIAPERIHGLDASAASPAVWPGPPTSLLRNPPPEDHRAAVIRLVGKEMGNPGDPMWTGRVEGRLTPMYAVLREARNIRAFNLSDGRIRWQRLAPKPVASLNIVGDLVP